MTRNQLRRRIHALQSEERGFTLLEIVIAMGILLSSLTVLASTALIGFRGAQIARQRQAATGLADRLVEQVRGLPFSVIAQGLKDSDLTGDPNVVTCTLSGVAKPVLGSCSGETIVHSSGASTAPLTPNHGSAGPAQGYPSTMNWSLYVTNAAGSTDIYRLTIEVSWSTSGSAGSIQTQTLLTQPQGTGDSSTETTGGNTASYNGTASVSSGNVVITPNGAVNNGIGITGLTTSVWNSGDNITQSMYALDAELTQGQTTKANGQSTLTSAQKTISGTTTVATGAGATTFSTADDDVTTTAIGPTSTPTGISQTGPSMTLTGGGNTLGLNQFSQSSTTTSTLGTVGKKSSSSATSTNGSITIAAPANLADGDFLLLQLSYQGNSCMSTPAGWTSVTCDSNSSSSNKVTSSIFYRWWTTASTWSGTFSTGNNNGTVGGVVDYSSVDTSDPINTSGAATGSSTLATTPAVTISTGGTRLVDFFAAFANTTITPVDPGGTASSWGQSWSAVSGGSQASKTVGGASSGGTKKPAGTGPAPQWTATLSQSDPWVAQVVALKPATITTTTIIPGAPGTETGSTVSTTQAQAAALCGTPTQMDGWPCAFAAQSYAVPSGATDGAFLQAAVDLTGSGLGACKLYTFNPPSSSPTNFAYGHRTSGGKIAEDVKRYYGTHTFGQLCAGTGSTPTGWPGYFVKYDAANLACEATAEAGVGAGAPTKTTAGTISVWNGSGVSSFAVPTTGTPWGSGSTTAPATIAYTTNTGYVYNISAKTGSSVSTLSSGASFTTQTGTTDAKSVVGAPVAGTITYKLTNPSGQVLIDLTITIDLGTLTTNATYTAAAT